jgi:hypothetical protein
VFCSLYFSILKSNKAQWSGTCSVVICYLVGRITSPLDPVVSVIIFLLVRVGLSRVMVCVSKHVMSGTEQQRGQSQQVVGWPLESGRDVRIKTCVNGTSLFPEGRVLSEKRFYVLRVEASC